MRKGGTQHEDNVRRLTGARNWIATVADKSVLAVGVCHG
jgi:hypothetical protein